MVGQSEFKHHNAAVIASRSRVVRPRSVNSTRHYPQARQLRMATVSSIEVRVLPSDLGHSELNRLPRHLSPTLAGHAALSACPTRSWLPQSPQCEPSVSPLHRKVHNWDVPRQAAPL
jgi:hypothetical protein